MAGKIGGYSNSIRITPTITAGAYSADDALGNEMELDFGVKTIGTWDAYTLQSVSLVDKGKQDAEIDVLFFDASVTPASDNAAADFTDAQLAANFLGIVTISGSDYGDLNDNSVATVKNVGLQLRPVDGTGSIYAYAVTRGTPTYTSTTDLVFKFDVIADL